MKWEDVNGSALVLLSVTFIPQKNQCHQGTRTAVRGSPTGKGKEEFSRESSPMGNKMGPAS